MTALIEGVKLGIAAAAKWAEDDAKLCDCEAHSESECACGAWCEWKTVPMHHVVQAIRALNPTAILAEHTRLTNLIPPDRKIDTRGTVGDSDGDDGA
jgi:hypothetical protein